jgi:hypothetical protein
MEEGIETKTGIFNNGRGSRFFCCARGVAMFEMNTHPDAAPYQGAFDN